MRLIVLASGQIKGTPEADLFGLYENWISRRGRPIGITQFDHIELRGKKSTQRVADDRAEIGHALDRIISDDPQCFCVMLDERGTMMGSHDFAQQIQKWCDSEIKTLCFIIGGADGLGSELVQRAHFLLSLGRMSWPHLLARAMLAEQIWRGISILTNHPYHRD